MAKRPKHLRKKVKEPAQIEKPSRTSRSGRTMIGPPIVKRLSSFITDLQEGKISLKSTLPVIFFLLFMLAAVVVFYRGF